MKIAPLVLVALLVGCAAAPPPVPEDFMGVCTERYSTMPRRESLESYLRWCQDTEVVLESARRERARREFGAMAAAVVLGAASDALWVNNMRRAPLETLAPYRR